MDIPHSVSKIVSINLTSVDTEISCLKIGIADQQLWTEAKQKVNLKENDVKVKVK